MTGMSLPRPRLRMEPAAEDASVTPIELFFDLVFVFALTQVTSLMAADLGDQGVLRGLLILALLWWSWVGYAWFCNVVRVDEGPVRLVLLLAMAAMFVLALAIPEAFDDRPGGLQGPIVVALCYFVFRLMHLVLFWVISRDDPGLRRQLVKFTPSMLGGTVLLLVASQFTGTTQTVFWGLALLADYGGTLLAGSEGWRLRSASHFAERHGLIVIVALGESIVAIGVGVGALPISWPIVGASGVGLSLCAALWWTYFDISALQGEHALARRIISRPSSETPREKTLTRGDAAATGSRRVQLSAFPAAGRDRPHRRWAEEGAGVRRRHCASRAERPADRGGAVRSVRRGCRLSAGPRGL